MGYGDIGLVSPALRESNGIMSFRLAWAIHSTIVSKSRGKEGREKMRKGWREAERREGSNTDQET